MAALSQDNCDLIANCSLSSSLDHLRKPLLDVEQSHAPSPYDRARGNARQHLQNTVSRVLTALIETEIALILRSRTSSRNIAGELNNLWRQIRKDNLNYDLYRSLVRLVIRQASDVEI